MKYSQWIGIAAAILLVVACFIPWTFYPDLNKYFTGFFSENRQYGRPGKLLVAFALISSALFAIPKVWAKRWNLLMGALLVAYAIRCFIVFSGCYHGVCPAKQAGIWLMLISSIVMLVMTLLPDLKVIDKPGA